MTRPPDKSKDDILRHAKRMKSNRENPGPSPLRGIGTFGMIGWSIVVPTVGGAFLGRWLDRAYPQTFSWTIALIIGGVVVGAFIVMGWIKKEENDE